jgi:hypothetical protein
VQEVLPGPPDQVRRLERYRQKHPDVDIQPPGAESAVWRAFRDGNLIAYGFTLMVFLDRLEALPGPLAQHKIPVIIFWPACGYGSAGAKNNAANAMRPGQCG